MRAMAAAAGAAGILAACSSGGGDCPVLAAIEDSEIAIGATLTIPLLATDGNGDEVVFGFFAPTESINMRAGLTPGPNNTATFIWRPTAQDRGVWPIEFAASDGGCTDQQVANITVVATNASAPVFLQPLGPGTTLNLDNEPCVGVDGIEIVIDDQDSTTVVIGHGTSTEPRVQGSTISQTGGLEGAWLWCPTEPQIMAGNQYTTTLTADDLINPLVEKPYLIVLEGTSITGCPGEGPVVVHTPGSHLSNSENVQINVHVTDDMGLGDSPIFFYSFTDPGANPDLGAMSPVTTTQVSGNSTDGVWRAVVPNPVLTEPVGTTESIFYVVSASDDDDPVGTCDHTTKSPPDDAYEATVNNECQGWASGDADPLFCSGVPCCDQTSCEEHNEVPGYFWCCWQPGQAYDATARFECCSGTGSGGICD